MPVDASVRTLLNPRVLTRMYSAEMDVPTPFTDAFFVNPEQVDDDTFSMFVDPLDRELAPTNHPGAEARVVTTGDADEKIMALFTVFNKLPMKGVVLTALRDHDSPALQAMGRREVNRVLMKFRRRHVRLKEVILAKTLTAGVVYLDNQGRVLESSSGAAQTADFDVPSGNKGNLGGIISALWSIAGTKISDHIEAIDDAAAKAGVMAPTDIWIHKLNLKHLRNNTQFETWAKENPQMVATVIGGGMIEGLWGKRWHFVGEYYKATDGTTKPLIPLDKAIFTPPPGGDWMRSHVGPTVLPSLNGLAGTIEEALNSLNLVHGEFAYAKVVDDPVRLFAYAGDKFALHFAEPNAIWMAEAFPAA